MHVKSADIKVVIKHHPNKNPDFCEEVRPELERIREEIENCIDHKYEELNFNWGNVRDWDNSIFTGKSGIALVIIKKNSDLNVETLQPEVLEQLNDVLPKNIQTPEQVSFLYGDSGPLVLSAYVAYKSNNKVKMNKMLNRLESMMPKVLDINSDVPDGVLYGRAGYLYSLLWLNKNIKPQPILEADIMKVVEALLMRGRRIAKEKEFPCPLMYQWNDMYYLGTAHGICGILYMLLHANLSKIALYDIIKPTLDYLIYLRYPSSNFPSTIGNETDKLVQWCHGAPGFVFLYCQAYRIFSSQRYLQMAIESGDVVWERGLLKKGYSLCHGVAGNAYCFLELYQTTKDVKYLYRAYKFAEWCMNYEEILEEHPPDKPYSLFEGSAGPMYLLLDIQKPMEAKFPGFAL